MRRYPVWVLLLAACSRTPGELGQGEFKYYCVGPGDPYCDCDEHAALCGGGPSPTIEQILYNRVPDDIAVGASFRLTFSGPDNANPQVVSVSPSMLTGDDELQALLAGEVGVLGVSGVWVLDFLHVSLVAPTAVRVDRVDQGLPRLTALELLPGETAQLRAMSMAGSRILYGQLPCSWSSDSATAIRLSGDVDDNLSQITALAPGVATVRVDLGALRSEVVVTVLDASGVGGAP